MLHQTNFIAYEDAPARAELESWVKVSLSFVKQAQFTGVMARRRSMTVFATYS